jgi:kynurenine formamidase
MTILDLSHTLENEMPVFPGSPPVEISNLARISLNGYQELHLKISTHSGTHIDCGKHLFEDASGTDDDPRAFIGRGMVIPCPANRPEQLIKKSHVKNYERQLQTADFVLLHTGWSRFWGRSEYFRNFPVLHKSAAQYLCSFSLKGIGIDAAGFDTADSYDLPNHHLLLSSGMALVENLCNLDRLPATDFLFSCLPLKIKHGDGSPVRAVAIIYSGD